MSAQVDNKLAALPEILGKATDLAGITAAVVDVERQVLRSVVDTVNSNADTESYQARDFILGERNTRGLSWKLVLMREIALANFCQMKRIGVHGGVTQILGQPSNVDVTIAVYNAVGAALDPLGQKLFTTFNDGRAEDKEAPAVHKVGWVNKFMIDAPATIGAALKSSLDKDTAANGKVGKIVETKDEALKAFVATLAPAKVVKEPKAPKAPKEPKAGKKKSDAEIIAAQNAATASDLPNDGSSTSGTEGVTATEQVVDLGPAGT